jgi:hypothetical protein
MRVIRVFRQIDGARYGSLASVQPIIEIGDLTNSVFTRDSTYSSATTGPNALTEIVTCGEGAGNSGYSFGPTQPTAKFISGLATFTDMGFVRDTASNPNADVTEAATVVFNYVGLQVITSAPFSISNATKLAIKSAMSATLFANRKISVSIIVEVQDAQSNPVLLAGIPITLTGIGTVLTGTLSGVTNASGQVTFDNVTPSNGSACNMAASIVASSLGLTAFSWNTVILQKEIIKPRRSEVAGKIPSSLELDTYEMAINLTDKKIFAKKLDGTVVTVSDLTDMTNANIAYDNRIASLTTNGSSGASTLAANNINIPNYTLTGLGGLPSSGGTISGSLIVTNSVTSTQLFGADIDGGAF